MKRHGWKLGAGMYVCFFIIFIIQDTDWYWYLLLLTPIAGALLDVALAHYRRRYWLKRTRDLIAILHGNHS